MLYLKNWPIHCHILDYELSTLTLPQLLIRGDDYTVFCPTYDAEIFALSLPVQTFICKQEDRESSNLYHLGRPTVYNFSILDRILLFC